MAVAAQVFGWAHDLHPSTSWKLRLEAKIRREKEGKASVFCKVAPGAAPDEGKGDRKDEARRETRTCLGRAFGDAAGNIPVGHRNFLLERAVRLWKELRKIWNSHPLRCPRNSWMFGLVTRWESGMAWMISNIFSNLNNSVVFLVLFLFFCQNILK